MTRNKLLLPFIVLLLLLTIFSLHIPFFWDSAFFSSISVHFYTNGFNGFIGPEEFDTGGFPLYSAYMTSIWKLFGKTLAVSHFAIFPFLVGLLFEFYKLCKRYLNEKTIIWALVLFMIEPVFLTQSILMGYDILIAYFFLLALNAVYNKKHFLLSLALLFLCLISLRGIMLASAIFFIDCIHHKKINLKIIVKYIPAFFILLVWFFYHKQQTGWYLFSPYREGEAEAFISVEMIFRQLIYIIWKSIDLGRLAQWMIIAFFAVVYFKKQKSQEYKELFYSLFISLLMPSLFMILIFNPIGHKYFLVVFILLNVAVCYFIQQILNKGSRVLLFSLLIVNLIAGNFYEYPQRYGNAWDSSLKIVPYFSMETSMRTYVMAKKIDPKKIGTQFPLTTDCRNSTLAGEDRSEPYADIEENDINAYPYFLFSNIINSGRMDDLERIKQTWIVEKEIKSGLVELILYRNPDL